MLELVIIAGVAYTIYTGKVKDVSSAARYVGQLVGRAAGNVRRIRSQAAELASNASNKPGVSNSALQLRNTMAEFNSIRSEALSATTVAGNRTFIQNHFKQRWAGQPAGTDVSQAVFSEAEIREALGGSPKTVSSSGPLPLSSEHRQIPSASLATCAQGIAVLSRPPSSSDNRSSPAMKHPFEIASHLDDSAVALHALCAALDADQLHGVLIPNEPIILR
jgi:hypothetical protein